MTEQAQPQAADPTFLEQHGAKATIGAVGGGAGILVCYQLSQVIDTLHGIAGSLAQIASDLHTMMIFYLGH